MIKIFYILNGSNDLFYPLNKNLEDFKNIIKDMEGIEVYCLYKIIKSDPLDLWTKTEVENEENKVGSFIYSNKKFRDIEWKEYFDEEEILDRKVKYLNIGKFLKRYLNNDDYNILMISGHGGPFQALLDLETSPGISINTLNLIEEINGFNIKLLFLDMCAMNYIEIIYEILYKRKIEKVITYKNFAPFEGIDYREFLEYIVNKDYKESFEKLKEPLIYLDSNMIKDMEKLKLKMNLTIIDGIDKKERKFKNDINEFRKEKVKIGLETEVSKNIPGNTLNYIKYFLNDEVEREIYGHYKFAKNNYWNIVVREKIEVNREFKKNIIPIGLDGLKNIIDIHKKGIEERELEKLVLKLVEERNEKDIYFK